MKGSFHPRLKHGFFLAGFLCLFAAGSFAQLALRHFVVYGKEGVTIASSSVEGGAVGSALLIKTTGGPNVGADLFSNGTVELSNNTNVTGKIMAGPTSLQSSYTGNAFSMGTNGVLSRNLYVNGNISISNTIVSGKVFQAPGASYQGPTLAAGQRVVTDPQVPAIPVFPVAAMPAFSTNTSDNITGNKSINASGNPANNYSFYNVALTGGKKLTFKGAGKYYFNSIVNTGSNTLEFDFTGSSTGLIEIYVKNTVDLGKSVVSLVNGGVNGAGRIAIYIWGTGTAFNIANGSSGGTQWQGTIFAYNGSINIGSGANASKVVGALFSNKQVSLGSSIMASYAPLDPCGLSANAGADLALDCDNTSGMLTGTGKTGTGILYQWTADEGGQVPAPGTTSSITVTRPGTYTFTITDNSGACPVGYNQASDVAVVTFNPCVVGSINPPSKGKSNDIIGSELNALVNSGGAVDPLKNAIFQLKPNDPGKVLIDIITKHGQTNALYQTLILPEYGLSDTVNNGPNSLILTGWYPIANLLKLNADLTPYFVGSKISYVRPVYPALVNTGTVISGGDKAIRADYTRNGFGLNGAGVKIGIISDSYNNLNVANLDVDAGELPGVGTLNPNPVNPVPVQVVKDYPFASKTDEGRAMAQIAADVASGALLAFRTGFITPSDFAIGIRELAFGANCDIICDDITYITEPFFRPGVVADAIRDVVAAGKHYVTAAGNFASKSYEGVFTPAAAGYTLPTGILGEAHDFGGGSIYQNITVKAPVGQPGVYTLVLQWEDLFYSLSSATSPNGSNTDLDLYALDQANNIIGYNRINILGDPTEILTFVVNPKPAAEVVANVKLLIVRAPGSAAGSSVRFKYVVFRGDFTFNDLSQPGINASTIVGQGNAPEAITVGAMRYNRTAQFLNQSLEVESFSSRGGTYYQPNTSTPAGVAQKPDITAPDGVNTTVNMGTSVDPEGDGIKNFFGTSAAAPHVAGSLALLVQAKQKFHNATLAPDAAKTLIKTTALPMYGGGAPAYHPLAGFGFLQVDAAVKTMANPTPLIDGINYDQSTPLGATPKAVTVHGNYFQANTRLQINGTALTTSYISEQELSATIPVFTGNKVLTAYTPKKEGQLAGDSVSNQWSLTGINKVNLVIRAKSYTVKFLASLPAAFESRIYKLVNGAEVEVTDPAEIASYGLSTLNYTTNATVGSLPTATGYTIAVSRVANANAEQEAVLNELYGYSFTQGSVIIEPLNVRITPLNKTAVYGQHIGDIEFNYEILDAVADPNAALELLKAYHMAYVPSNAMAVVEGLSASELSSLNTMLQNQTTTNRLALMASLRAIFSSRAFDVVNNRLVAAASLNSLNLFYVVDLNKQAILDYMANPNLAQVNLFTTLAAAGQTQRAMINVATLNTNAASVNGVFLSNAGYVQALRMVNAQTNAVTSRVPAINNMFFHQLNGITSGVGGGGLVQFVNGVGGGGLVQFVNGVPVPLPEGQPVVLSDGSVVANAAGGGGLVQFVNGAGVPILLTNGQTFTFANGASMTYTNGVGGGGLLQIVNAAGGGGLLQIVNGTSEVLATVPQVNQVSVTNTGQLQYNNVVLVANRVVLSNAAGGGGLLQIVNGVGGGGLLQIVNGVGGGGLLQIVNAAGGGGLLQIVNGVGGGGLLQIVNSPNNYGLPSNTAILFDIDDVNSGGNIGPMHGINFITGLTAGAHSIVGGAFLSDLFKTQNGIGTLTITKSDQTISFGALASKTTLDAPFILSATASSGLPVSFAVSGPATFNAATSTLTITGAGTVTVTASQAGDGNFNAASNVEQSFTVSKVAQTITFGALANKTTLDAPFVVSATASSGLPVSFAVSGPATFNASTNTVTIAGAGTVTVTASQAGNGSYSAAPNVQQSFSVSKVAQTITFDPIPNKTNLDAPFTLAATASSGLPVSYTVSGPVSLSGTTVTITGSGTASVTASQAGNASYLAATPVTRTFTIGSDPCLITHSIFNSFNSTNKSAATMWVNVKIKINGELSQPGQYVEYYGGTVTFADIATSFTGAQPIPRGIVIATSTQAPFTTYNAATNSFRTEVPVGYSTNSDLFISGALVYSSNGFTKGKAAYTEVKGAFRTNRPSGFAAQWLYGMAAYQYPANPAYFTYAVLAGAGNNAVSPINGTYKSGTPIPFIAYLANGGTGSGGTNYSGNTSSVDALNPCLVNTAALTFAGRGIGPVADEPAVNEPKFSLSPNPAGGKVNLSFVPAQSGRASIRVYSLKGALVADVFSGNVTAGQLYQRSVNTAGLPSGLYMVQYTSEGRATIQKLVVQHER